jgi:hypothetical protein
MKKIDKIQKAVKRKVNENRLRRGIKSILEASITRRFQKAVEALQKVQLDQQKLRKAFVAEKNPKKKEVLKKAIIKMHYKVKQAEEDFNRAMHVEPVDYIEDGVRPTIEENPELETAFVDPATMNSLEELDEGKLNELTLNKSNMQYYALSMMKDIGLLNKIERKTYQNWMSRLRSSYTHDQASAELANLITSTGKLNSAMHNKFKKWEKKFMEVRERAYASTDGKPYFDYDPGKDKLTEGTADLTDAEQKIFDKVFKGGVDKLSATEKKIVRKLINQGKITAWPFNEGKVNEDIASAERWFENMKYWYNTTALRSPDLKNPKDKKHFNKLVKKYFSSIREGKLTEGAYYKKGQKVRYQIDRGSPKALRPSIGTISKIKKVGHGYQYIIQDGGPVPVWEAEILGPTSHNEGKLTESMIGIKTKANFKPNSLKGALERAGIKGFQMNRLSWSLTALKVDKKDFNNAKKIIDKLGLSVMMVKEGKITEGNIVTRNAWNRMSDDEKIDALQTAYEDPAEAMKHYDKKWEDLPSVATQNMYKEGKLKEIDMDRVFMKGRTKKRTTDESTKKKQYSKGDVIKVSIPKVATTKGKVVMIKQYQGAPVYLIKSPKGNLVAHQDHVIGLNEGIQHREDKKQQITELAKLNKMQRNAILGLLGLSILGFTFKAAAAPFFLLFAGYMHVNDFIEAQRYARKNPAKVAQMHQDHRGSQGYDVRLNSFM